ncbi:PEP-utilizing enzyme [Euzebya tangerina]|uniref:PEP-utilizing enzyme n=1 Tax=Euzebya tangerina TaxID=591198 RepID=UPI000E324A2C|nr:PEP-utilizing enzyme [Euzebya tangerina]
MAQRFPDPFDVPTPDGADGWEDMFSYYHLFGEERREADTQTFWFQDRLHHPGALYPYDEIQCECWWQALGAFNTRIFSMPPAFGVDQRVLNGYLYVSPVPAPPDQIEARAEEFGKRASHYYENWDEIYEEWKTKVTDRLETIRGLDFSVLPELEDESVVTSHRGTSSGYQMIENFSTLITTMYETYQFHFELLNIGYAAYLTFFGFCKEAFPDIPDQTISRMVGGLHVDLYRPDDELKRLAKEAVRLNLTAVLADHAGDPEALFSALNDSEAGQEWAADYRRTEDPWFLFNTDPGHPGGYHTYPTWQDDPRLPLSAIRDYVTRIEAGDDLDRPTEHVLAERDRITGEYRELLAADDQGAFDEMVALARKVFVYIEEHVLYIEHWMWATFWAKSKEVGATLAAMGGLDEAEDMFYLRRTEVADLIYDVVAAWSVGAASRGAAYWRPIVARRREIWQALDAYDAPEALGPPPAEVTEPFTVMLWGITTDTVAEWLADDEGDEQVLRGIAGSPGVVEGRARVVKRVEELDAVEEGEVLICPATSPSWSTIFSQVSATVSDVGGIMSHAAIVCREYGLPAVVGTGKAVSTIQTGQLVRVDGDNGTVTVLDG